jgi:hypothetical protein
MERKQVICLLYCALLLLVALPIGGGSRTVPDALTTPSLTFGRDILQVGPAEGPPLPEACKPDGARCTGDSHCCNQDCDQYYFICTS